MLLMGKPQNGNPEDAVGSDNANPARLSLQQIQSCRWIGSVHADWCQEDQRQDEFLKELTETAELADPSKATKVVPVQCQAVPEWEAVANASHALQQCS
uniref:Uncharacterized protein n=1 Tax=Sphaerodactylus townsendi TaxID=933632 RepID=A0ACB8GD47_9SAUR